VAHDAVVLKAGGGIGNGGADGKRFAIARFGARHVPQVAIVGIALYVAQAIVAAGDFFKELAIAPRVADQQVIVAQAGFDYHFSRGRGAGSWAIASWKSKRNSPES
jgi:hypothetical protein